MKNLSRYQLLIKNEQRKVKDVVGICPCGGTRTNKRESANSTQDDIELIQNMYTRAGANAETNNRPFDEIINSRERRRNRRHRQRNCTDTNVYRFENQGLVSNTLGNSNRLIERSRCSERSTIDKILKKYMRTDNF